MFSRHPEPHQQIKAGQRRRAGARGDQLDLLEILALLHRCAFSSAVADDNGGAMLIVV